MTSHQTNSIERHCDVLIVGGSAAGLAAALQLGRQRRSVIVVDAGEPRNARAAHMHSYLGFDGTPPSDLTAAGRDEVRSYGGEVVPGRVVDVSREQHGFRAELAGGHSIVARRLLLATGIVDELPDIDGVADHWGAGVIHCPFCHGYEVRDRRVVQIITHPMGLHSAALFRQLTDMLTLIVHEPDGIETAELQLFEADGVEVVRGRATRITTTRDGQIGGVELDDGSTRAADTVVVGPRFRADTGPFAGLGLRTVAHASGLGDIVETDESGATSVTGVSAAGNVTNPGQQVLQAAADGSWAGGMIAASLARDDLVAADRPSSNEVDWDHRYAGDRIWSGNPNGALVAEIDDLRPGTALDVGAGEGGDAIWLAERGWSVTATEISTTALELISAEADRRGLDIACLHGDANAHDAFRPRSFDLVTAHYASIPRTADRRAIRNMLDAVAPGGTLLVVGHDIEPMRSPIDTRTHSRPFDADAYVRVDDITNVIRDDPAWTIEVDETRPRPPGAAPSASHHVDDAVLRARRSTS